MKILATLLLSFLTFGTFGQGQFNPYPYIFSDHYLYDKPLQNVRTMLLENYDKKGKLDGYTIRKYNEFGKCISSIQQNGEGVETRKLTYKYFGENQIQETVLTKKGKIVSIERMEINDQNKIISYVKFKKGNQLKVQKTWTYNDQGNVSKSTYAKRHNRIKSSWEHSYYSKNKPSQTLLLNRKGKVKRQWTFDCIEEGEQLNLKKNQSLTCVLEERDGDTLTKVYQTFDSKGKAIKLIQKYRVEDSVIVAILRYNDKDEVTMISRCKDGFDSPTVTQFYRKGKLHSSTNYQYQEDILVEMSHNRKGKLVYRKSFEVSPEGLYAESSFYNRKNKLQSRKVFTYER